jgi:TetR/AcrR family transcriptional regulator, transcriptional repressor for nem operon
MSKAERTKAFIVEKVAPIFNQKGYAGTSLNDMTEATGLTKGSIYGNFANKDEVALAVFDYNLNQVSSAIKSQINQRSSAKDKLLVYAECYERLLLPPFTPGGCPILNTAVESDDTHPELRKKAISAILSWRAMLTHIITEGIKAGEFRETVNPSEVAITMIAMIEGGIMITKLMDDVNSLQIVMSSLKKFIEDLT